MKKKSNLSRLMDCAGKYRWFTYASWVLSSISAFVALMPFIYIWRIVKEILDVSPNFSEATNLVRYGVLAMVFAVAAFLIYVLALICSHLAAFRVASNFRISLNDHIAKLPLGFVDNFGSGRLRKIINDSTGATETYLAHQLPDKAVAISTPIGLLILLFVFDWRLGLLSLIPVALAFLVMMKMAGRRMKEKMVQYNNALENMSNEAVEYVRGIPVVKTFSQTVFSFKKFKQTIDEYKKWVVAYTLELRPTMLLYTVVINSVFVFLIAGALWFTKDGVSNEFILNLIFYIIITPIISLTLTKIMFMSENNMVVDDAISRIDEVLNAKPIEDKPTASKPIDYSIELNDVHFSYDDKKEIIKGISLKASSGETIALVGPSGGGKSTLASLMVRFFDPENGSIKIGGVNIKEISKEDLMNMVSFVFQNSKLIKASILDNMKMAKADATNEEIINALKAAQCMDIIDKLPNGINTIIGTNGIYLSGGEQQRISIARAILKNSPIIILDEATAFADADNEAKVQEAFSYLAKNKTVIMIAHRLSTIVSADAIYVINDGQIIEHGTLDELISKQGLFTKMWNDYNQSVKWKVTKEGE